MYWMLQKWDVGQWWDCSARLPTKEIALTCAMNMRACGHKIQVVKHATEDTVAIVDERPMSELAKEAVSVQNASNLSGLVFGMARAMERFNELNPHVGTDKRNTHPIFVLWTGKLAELSGAVYGQHFGESLERASLLADTGRDLHLDPIPAASAGES